MTDTDPQREGETLQREYPDPSVLGGEVVVPSGGSSSGSHLHAPSLFMYRGRRSTTLLASASTRNESTAVPALFTRVRGRKILRTSSLRRSKKFAHAG
jgi:hypothetical protein